MKIAKKRKAGEILGRSGISERILFLASRIVERGSYKDAMEIAGQIAVLVEAASCDEYWNEKAQIGRWKEEGKLENVLRDPVVFSIDPRKKG